MYFFFRILFTFLLLLCVQIINSLDNDANLEVNNCPQMEVKKISSFYINNKNPISNEFQKKFDQFSKNSSTIFDPTFGILKN